MIVRKRCFWVDAAPNHYVDYHDCEWGFPVADARRLFEKLCLEGFQSGLSGLTILRESEEFLFRFIGIDETDLVRRCEELCLALEREDWTTLSPGLSVTMSVGLAACRDASDASTLLDRADTCLYSAGD